MGCACLVRLTALAFLLYSDQVLIFKQGGELNTSRKIST